MKSNIQKLPSNGLEIKEFIKEQRITYNKNIKKLYQEHKKHLHTSEYDLVLGLFKGFEPYLVLGYMDYLNSGDEDTFVLFDVWAMDFILKIYKDSV